MDVPAAGGAGADAEGIVDAVPPRFVVDRRRNDAEHPEERPEEGERILSVAFGHGVLRHRRERVELRVDLADDPDRQRGERGRVSRRRCVRRWQRRNVRRAGILPPAGRRCAYLQRVVVGLLPYGHQVRDSGGCPPTKIRTADTLCRLRLLFRDGDGGRRTESLQQRQSVVLDCTVPVRLHLQLLGR